MSPLSREELSPSRLCHKTKLPEVPAIVRWCLEDGIETAPAIKEKTGLPLERVYEALVWLEGHGKAAVTVARNTRQGNAPYVSWGAL